MKPFIEIAGVSGTVYRFQWVSGPSRLPATAGNFIFFRSAPDGDEIVCCGTARSLVLAATAWERARDQYGAASIYVRLNVSRAIRSAEHQDIAARQAPMVTITELD
ncbi:hypothetical protein [Phenylobacterium montanum]|uniref:Uncharacterized protein n=1 Tax=Phenylobacterium montanum TaxID=2823693 RepID=A0A975IVZ8_9CAUL|nr:hypothetical protein [Caulobacter sp. S6]QUD89552.1 hypothetical protein KCG34_06635 [Caulobacter sp. S6]